MNNTPSNTKAGIRLLALFLAVIVAVAAGCGSDDDDGDGGGGALAQEEVISEGDAICDADYAALADITVRVTQALRAFQGQATAENRDAVTSAIDDFIANLEGTASALGGLDAPEEGQEALTGYVDSLEQQIATLEEARDAFAAGELGKYDRLGDDFNAAGRTASRQAAEYGFTSCTASSFG